jgi:hypothetical protein
LTILNVSGDTSSRDLDDIGNTGDTTSATDADTYEMLQAQVDHSAAIVPEPVPTLPSESSTLPSIQLKTNELDHPPSVIVDQFPHSSPGVPISGAHQGSPMDDSGHDVLGESIWAPFHSDCNWEIAHWAKMCSPTSSVLTDLLVVPGVQEIIFYFILFHHLHFVKGHPKAWVIIQHGQ